MCAEAHSKGAKLPALREQIERNPGKPGVVRLAKLLDRRTGPARPKRELERRLLKLVRASDLPHPEVNAWLEGKERDLVWREQRVVVEADSYTFHGDPASWAKDIGKTNELQLLGYVVLRFTWFDVTERRQWVIGEIRRRDRTCEAPAPPGRASHVSPRQVSGLRERQAASLDQPTSARFAPQVPHLGRSTGCLAQRALVEASARPDLWTLSKLSP